ncbi:hypothetical protein [Cyclobacterium jeungdonense]|uniref:Uncharacterized protein n=1 Tax=Cyclobacterium jeungdonense TaxID=708087 RepID=A0ABT8CEX4_9BACT|nr:hypothetical protein [Cyclobacterium jeungdonense]MDN3690509.1 hypothetical protein [Cyclobacterium jeungdonense]
MRSKPPGPGFRYLLLVAEEFSHGHPALPFLSINMRTEDRQ